MFEETTLIVEDDIRVQDFIKYTLEEGGYQTLCIDRDRQAVEMAMTEKMDMILLDMGLPDMGGEEALVKLRGWSDTPVVIVSARGQEKEKIMAFNMRANGYLTKPLLANELLTRIHPTFRRYFRTDGKKTSSHIEDGELEVDNDKHTASQAGGEIRLTKLEFALLLLFMQNQGKVLTYGYILREPYGKDCGLNTQMLRTLVAGLRRRIGENPAKSQYITTGIGIRYRMMEQWQQRIPIGKRQKAHAFFFFCPKHTPDRVTSTSVLTEGSQTPPFSHSILIPQSAIPHTTHGFFTILQAEREKRAAVMEKGEICLTIKTLIEQGQYEHAYELIVNYIKLAPDDASQHNLLEILYEKQGNHVGGMKHFRTAWALDAACLPARWNMELYGGFEKGGKTCAYLIEKCQYGRTERGEGGYEAV